MSQDDPNRPAALVATGLSTGYPRAHHQRPRPEDPTRRLYRPGRTERVREVDAPARTRPASPASSRHLLLDGRAIAEQSSKEVARRIGSLPQAPEAPEGLSVIDLVRQGRYPHRLLFGRWTAADEAACQEALEVSGLMDLRNRPLDSLSGGQKQRAWIAVTLAQQTGILLLDEPTTYLDLAHQVEVLDLLGSLVKHKGATVVAVLNDQNQAARYAVHIVMMKAGAIVAEGAAETTVTAEWIAALFGVTATVIANPVDGTPLMITETRHYSLARYHRDQTLERCPIGRTHLID